MPKKYLLHCILEWNLEQRAFDDSPLQFYSSQLNNSVHFLYPLDGEHEHNIL